MIKKIKHKKTTDNGTAHVQETMIGTFWYVWMAGNTKSGSLVFLVDYSNLFAINKVHNITVHKNYISLGWTDRRQLRTYVPHKD